MNWRIIRALIFNDYRNFFRDKLFGVMTVFGMVMFILFYFIMPSTMDETIEIGLYAPFAAAIVEKIPSDEGLILHAMESEDQLKIAVIENRFPVGISISDEAMTSALSGERPRIVVYYSSAIPDEMREMNTMLIREMINEMINEMAGRSLDIDEVRIVLGPDMEGRQIPHRDRMLPMLVFMLLAGEIIGLSHLITSEVQAGTIHALMVTPMKVIDFFVGKGLTGLSMAFSQILLLMIVTTSMSHNVSLILVSLLLGAIMVTGIAFIIAAVAKEMMSVIAWGTLALIVMVIPAFAVMFPGAATGWIKFFPSYFLVDTLHRAINFNIGWGGNIRNILLLAGINVVSVSIGIVALKRKLA
jgi:hypothetical protein